MASNAFLVVECKKMNTRLRNLLTQHEACLSEQNVQRMRFMLKSNNELIVALISQALIEEMKS